MIKWIKIAIRNIIKNKRRSLVTITAIATGFASISLFGGYADNTFNGLRESAIRGEGLGHLTIFKEGWKKHGKNDPLTYMFSANELNHIMQLLKEEQEVVVASPQLGISGLVSNGSTSTIFLANGVIPDDVKQIRGDWNLFSPVVGTELSEGRIFGVEMAKGLADILKLSPGSDAVVMASTLDGQMNALDIQVSGTYDTGAEATNDKFLRVPFAFAQSLFDTEKADSIVVLLTDHEKTDSMKTHLKETLSNAGISVEIRTWYGMSVFYEKVKNLFSMIFLFIFIIVLVIVVMSIINTMGMTVLERTREIGTLRALGLKQRGVILLFAIEGAVLGFMGTLFGTLINLIVWSAIHYTEPSYIPPGSSSPVPLTVNLVPESMASLLLFLVALSLIASIIPAARAAKKNVVDALGYV